MDVNLIKTSVMRNEVADYGVDTRCGVAARSN
jgi:hypothetical protein